jgi:hypothetical protein
LLARRASFESTSTLCAVFGQRLCGKRVAAALHSRHILHYLQESLGEMTISFGGIRFAFCLFGISIKVPVRNLMRRSPA